MPNYENLSNELTARMERERQNGTYIKTGFDDRSALRRNADDNDRITIWRPNFAHDIDRIIHCPYYNRYSDKTQVFSLIKNDDITRRSLHVQLVSRIARTIGGALIGCFVIGILNNGMSLLGISPDWQQTVKGLVILGAVALDMIPKMKKK